MRPQLRELLDELAEFGAANDAAAVERGRRMLNITPDTGEFLGVLVRATAARRVLEIGTSNGYSTLWLADAADAVDGHITTVESAADKIDLAAENFRRAGLTDRITLVHDDAGSHLTDMAPDSVDLLFLDSVRSAYVRWWPSLTRVLRPGGLLVVDNAVSHAPELTEFTALVRADPLASASLVPVGKGELLVTRS
jgi:predicted O-methyltransferase YrrM